MGKTTKPGRIEICDSRKKKGMYFVRIVAANGEKLMHGECLTSPANVNKHILSVARVFAIHAESIDSVLSVTLAIDRTASGYWHKKYGIEKKSAR
jgi:uncharacterized protein YegP (UPF0339 family)